MSFFDDHLKDTESLFKDEMALDSEFIPVKIPFRENEQESIAETIKPLLKNRTSTNLFITGSPGIGKTVSVKHIFREMEQEGLNDKVHTIYVNCWTKDTAHKIVLEICNQLNYRFTINKTTDQLITEISKLINKKAAVIALDEIDKIEFHALSVIYHLLENIYRKSIILITNNKSFLSEIDQRIYSRLTPETIEFKPYNQDEIFQILKERTGFAFVPNTFKRWPLKLISEKASHAQDIRVGLFLLREAGYQAERRLKKSIEEQDAIEAINKLSEFKPKDDSLLGEEQKRLLEVIKEHSGKSSIELHSIYDSSISYKTFKRKLKELENARLISIRDQNFGETRKTIIQFSP